MITIIIQRQVKNDICTLGEFKAVCDRKEITGYTLEPPDLGNKKYISCILPGKYKAKTDKSKRYGDVIRFEDRNNRTNILIHPGNYPKDTQGCILVGSLKGHNVVWKSRDKMRELIGFVGDDEIMVEIKDVV